MAKVVPFEGPPHARIYVCGEAPGSQEEVEMRPFVGGSGRLLNRLLMEAGMVREECRIGNVMRVRPPGNNFTHFYLDKSRRIPSPELLAGIEYLREDIRRCNPNVVLVMGNEPLRALTDEKGITNWRGSVLFSKVVGCKVLATIHPASLLRSWDNLPLVMMDFKKLKRESETEGYSVPKRTFVLRPDFPTVMRELDRLSKCEKLSFDVETDREGLHITALALSDNPLWSMSIPFTLGSGSPYWIQEEEEEIWKRVKVLMEDERVGKIAQNAQFDIIMMRVNPYHARVKGLVMDTMCAHHTIYPEVAASESEFSGKKRIGGGKSLGVLCSIYTKQPFYKHWIHTSDDMQFWKYNAMDAAVTYEIAEELDKEMREFGVRDFYDKMVNPLISILSEMQMKGVKIDHEMRVKAYEAYERVMVDSQRKLDEAVGRPINVMAPGQMKELLYVDLKLPVKYKKGTTNVTTDEQALRELSSKYPSPIFNLVLEIRHIRKLLSTYLSDKGGSDGRMRCSYIVGGTETGRLSSRGSVFGSGGNLQNIPHGICRRMFVADEGKVLVAVDLSQAEARIVAYLAEEEKMIKVFESGGDIHQLTADTLPDAFTPSGSAYKDIENPRRLFAKKHVHAFNYGEGARAFAKQAEITETLARMIRDNYLDTFPGVKLRHYKVSSYLGKSRTIKTALGRKRTFFGRWGDQLCREAYAYEPQSVVADVLNLAMMRLHGIHEDTEFMLQVHDEFVIQCVPEEVGDWVDDIREAFKIPLTINGRTFILPIDIKVGRNWDEMEKI